LPTARDPTIATFLCFGGAGILSLAFDGARDVAERVARARVVAVDDRELDSTRTWNRLQDSGHDDVE